MTDIHATHMPTGPIGVDNDLDDVFVASPSTDVPTDAPTGAPTGGPAPGDAGEVGTEPPRASDAAGGEVSESPEVESPDVAWPEFPTPALTELAHALNIATEFWDWQGRHTLVRTKTIRAVLAALEIDARDDEAVGRSLHSVRERAWRRILPPTVVAREGQRGSFSVHVAHGTLVEAWAELETGEWRMLPQEDRWVEPRTMDGVLIGEATFTLPESLPLGWHRLHARGEGFDVSATLVITPQRLELPLPLRTSRTWGFMTQLYSVRSRLSWGLGDLADLAEIAGWSGRRLDAGFVLVNPLHAAEPTSPMEPSPYLPTTRRFVNPVYLRVEDIREVGYLPATQRAVVEWRAEALRELCASPDPIDRDTVWAAKRAALELVYQQPRSPERQAAFEAFVEREGEGLVDFATWCTLADIHGARTSLWPDMLKAKGSDQVRFVREERAAEVTFHMWLQWCLDQQLAAAQTTALEAGMPVGMIHDLAVGVHPDGADSWTLQGALAHNVTVGAPPDAFNQQGQDWSQPPWRPDRLPELGYAPYRDMLRTVLRHAGGLRVDHIIGLFRLWWVPTGSGPAEGTYVRYDHEALIGILALEAHRAGAVVVGEDLGTVEPWVRHYLEDRGVLGTSILWFERDTSGQPLRPEAYRELSLATVTTHDLPPTAGYLAGEHIDLRERLGLLTRTHEEETAADTAERESVLAMLRRLGLLAEESSEREKVEALHRFLTWTPAKLLGVSLADAAGERRAINQPGTYDEYPNWRLPMSDGMARPVMLEDLFSSLRAQSLARSINHR